MEFIGSLIALAAVGVFIGICSGLLGIGGGTIIVPVLRLGFGLSAYMATATSLFTIIPTSISGAVKHLRNKTCVPALGLAAGLGGACTSPVGVWLASLSPSWAIMVVAGIIIAYSAYNMFRKALKAPKVAWRAKAKTAAAAAEAATTAEGGTSATCAAGVEDVAASGPATAGAEASASESAAVLEPAPAPEQVKLSRKQLLQGALIGLVAGVASGYVGVGGGFIMVPMFLAIIGIPMKLASGTSLIAVMILATPGTIEQGLLGNIDYIAGLALAVGSIPGAVIGANLSRVIPERQLRFAFAGFLLIAAVLLMVKEAGLLG